MMAERRRRTENNDQDVEDIEAAIDALNELFGDTITPSDPDILEPEPEKPTRKGERT